jgi:hypothetical protein
MEDNYRELNIESEDEFDHDIAAMSQSRIQIVASRILYAKGFISLYLVMILVQIGLLIWGVVHKTARGMHIPESGFYIALDVIATAVLSIEVTLRVLAVKRYWSGCLNRVDFVCVLLSIGALFLYPIQHSAAVYGQVAIAIRYSLQLARLLLVTKQWHKAKRSLLTKDDDVDFSAMEDDVNYFEAETRTKLR